MFYKIRVFIEPPHIKKTKIKYYSFNVYHIFCILNFF